MNPHQTFRLSACAAMGFALIACSDEGRTTNCDALMEETGGFGAAGSSGYGGSSGFAGVGGTETDAAAEPSFEPFEIAIGQSVTVGAFVLEVDSVSVAPMRTLFDGERAKIDLAFIATNLSTALHTPLDRLYSDELLLDIGGEFFFGEEFTDEVPGLRQGAGTITWNIPAADLTPDEIRAGVITLGGADDNAVVIPLNDPTATVSLNDQPLDVAFIIQGHRKSTLEVTAARVEYGSREDNEPYEAGTAQLVLVGGLSGLSSGTEAWTNNNATLLRPDGLSVPPTSLIELVWDHAIDIEISFPITQPVSGTYEFVVNDEKNGESAVQTIVVP